MRRCGRAAAGGRAVSITRNDAKEVGAAEEEGRKGRGKGERDFFAVENAKVQKQGGWPSHRGSGRSPCMLIGAAAASQDLGAEIPYE